MGDRDYLQGTEDRENLQKKVNGDNRNLEVKEKDILQLEMNRNNFQLDTNKTIKKVEMDKKTMQFDVIDNPLLEESERDILQLEVDSLRCQASMRRWPVSRCITE